MTAVVVGSSGFIGSHLVDALLSQGVPVRAVVRRGPGLLAPSTLADSRLQLFQIDMADADALLAVCAGADVVFHLASSTLPQNSNLDPSFDVSSNLLGALHVLEAVRQSRGTQLVMVSSGGTVYGVPQQVPIPEEHPTDPTCSYGITKLAIEKYVALYRQLYGVHGVVLRVANPYGERQRLDAAQGVVPVFLGKALRGEPLEIWGDGSTVRDFLYISDLVVALLAAWRQPSDCFLFNVGSGVGLSLKALVGLLASQLNRPLKVVYHPPRGFDVPTNVLCIDRVQRCLGWQPQVSMAEGLQRFHRSLDL